MSKRDLLKLFEDQIAQSLAAIIQAANEAREAAIHTESKAEDQYDTRGLEASYLAGAQSRRAGELEQLLNTFRFVDIKEFTEKDVIASTALIELESEDAARSLYLMMPLGGGLSVKWEGKTVNVVTPSSPLGETLLKKRVGDQISIEIKGKIKDYDILSIS